METSWQDVAIEAIKILGPAMVTGVASILYGNYSIKSKA